MTRMQLFKATLSHNCQRDLMWPHNFWKRYIGGFFDWLESCKECLGDFLFLLLGPGWLWVVRPLWLVTQALYYPVFKKQKTEAWYERTQIRVRPLSAEESGHE